MRALLLALLALGLAGLAGFAWVFLSGSDSGDQPLAPAALGPGGPSVPTGDTQEPAPEPAVVARLDEVPEGPAAVDERPSEFLEGRILDRFGQPVPNERVFLLEPGQGHPPEGAPLGEYVTARTTRSGAFSLSIDSAGPWSIGVGPPGAPILPPSEPTRIEGGRSAQITIPGRSALSVEFEGFPETEHSISVELVTLREPTGRAAERGGRIDMNRMRERMESRRGGGRGRRGGDEVRERTGAEGDDEDTSGDGGNGGAGLEQEALPGSQEGRGRRGSNQGEGRGGRSTFRDMRRNRGGDQGDNNGTGNQRPGAGDGITVAPPEIWRTFTRYRLTDEEVAARRANIPGIPTGVTARLAVSIGPLRLEGLDRFSLLPDLHVHVRVMPISGDPADGLTYVATTKPPGPDAPRPGITWGE